MKNTLRFLCGTVKPVSGRLCIKPVSCIVEQEKSRYMLQPYLDSGEKNDQTTTARFSEDRSIQSD